MKSPRMPVEILANHTWFYEISKNYLSAGCAQEPLLAHHIEGTQLPRAEQLPGIFARMQNMVANINASCKQ